MYDDDAETPRASGGGFGRAVKNVFLFLLFAALAFGLLYLVAERNARRYFLVPEGDQLVVKRGVFFPVGEKPLAPDAAAGSEVYAPVPLPEGAPAMERQLFDERSELDRALFGLLAEWARERIRSQDENRLDRGLLYLRRAEQLPIYNDAQRQELERLRGEVAYYEARQSLEDASESLTSATEKLSRARELGAERAEESASLLRTVERQAAELRGTLEAMAEGRVPKLPAERPKLPAEHPEPGTVQAPAETSPPAAAEPQAPGGEAEPDEALPPAND